ncbi:MAG: hypothetical protein EBU90_00095 [Proteobacteria bacterium]|nr:hypothetical protein [Pseudomonadota bacterium]NBP12832.1 hypothetical protein [bacterium]
MNTELSIFLDLDNTLIHAVYGGNPNKRRYKLDLGVNCWGKKEVYWSMLRPMAHVFIAACRSLAPTYILTNSARDYALAHNKEFQLGFKESMVFAREDFSRETCGTFHSATFPLAVNQYPNAILVDDKSFRESSEWDVKIKFLGIGEDRYVKSRNFRGGKDPENFDKEFKAIEQIIELDRS